MTKSIEQQATEYADKMAAGGKWTASYHDTKQAYIDAAKSRDAEWLKVVNELREALKFYGSDSPSWQRLEHTNSIISDVDLIKPKTVLYKGQLSGGRTADESLTKAELMMKEILK